MTKSSLTPLFLAVILFGGNDGYEPGQWRARVTSYAPSVIGVGRFLEPFEDPTVFVTSSVANVLAEVYREDSFYEEIPPLLRSGVEIHGLHHGLGDQSLCFS